MTPRLLMLACAAAILGSPGVTTASQPDARLVATAAGGTITVRADEVRHELAVAVTAQRSGIAAERPTPERLEQLVRDILERKLEAAEARRLGVDSKPDVAFRIQRSVDTVLAEALARQTLAAVDTSPSAARRFYEANRERFRTQPRRRLRHIVVGAREEADRSRRELLAGRSFEEVARSVNTDDTRPTGGDLGWVHKGLMVAAFERAAFALVPGEISEVVQTSLGFHLITVEDVDPGTVPPFELIADRVAERIRAEAKRNYQTRMWTDAAPVIDRDALDTLLR